MIIGSISRRARRATAIAALVGLWLTASSSFATTPDAALEIKPFTLEPVTALTPVIANTTNNTTQGNPDGEQPWAFSLEAAFSASGGNTRQSNIDGRFDAKKEWEDSSFTAFVRAEWGEAKPKNGGDRVRDRNRQTAGAEYRKTLDGPLYAFAREGLEKDEFADIKLRSDTFVGVGTQLLKNDDHEVNAQVGVGYTSTDHYSTDRQGNPSAIGAQDWTWQVNEDWQFIETFEIIPNLKEIDEDFRTVTTADLKTDLTENMYLSFGVEHRYDSDPEGGAGREDWNILLKLGVKF